MAVEYTLICDGCEAIIGSSRISARAAKADAQLTDNAACTANGDFCKQCRLDHGKAMLATTVGHSIGTRC